MASASTSQPSSRRRSRALLFLMAALVIAACSFGLSRLGLNRSIPNPISARPSSVIPVGSLRPADLSPVQAPDAVPATGANSTQDLDKAIAVWPPISSVTRKTSSAPRTLGWSTTPRPADGQCRRLRSRPGRRRPGAEAHPDDLGAKTLKALLLYTLHDFEAARLTAQAIVDGDPGQLQALATVGDSQLEMGQYDAAAATVRCA